jgi:hypothetical protein
LAEIPEIQEKIYPNLRKWEQFPENLFPKLKNFFFLKLGVTDPTDTMITKITPRVSYGEDVDDDIPQFGGLIIGRSYLHIPFAISIWKQQLLQRQLRVEQK